MRCHQPANFSQQFLPLFKLQIILLFLIASTNSIAQSKKQKLDKAETTFFQEDFAEALKLYEIIEEEHPKEDRHLYHKNICKHLTFERGSDMTELLAFENQHGKTDKFFNYWIGRINLNRYEFKEAQERLNAFMALDVYKSKIILKETKEMLSAIDKAEPYYNNPDEYEIEQLPAGINTEFSEISPSFFSGHEELIFSSDRELATSENANDFLIYHSIKKGPSEWSKPSPIHVLGSFSYQNAKIEIMDHDKRLYSYSPENGGDIFYSSFEKGNWSIPKEFDSKIRNKHVESHFFINDSEDLILFVSGDSRNRDIWQTRLINGKWSSPSPVPGAVNSSQNEESPFLSHNGTMLYFSSDRPGSMGGFDIFRSEYDYHTEQWGEPENMGFPINTIDDEINFEVTPSDQSGYLSSNRLHSMGGFDIYYFHKIDKILVKGNIIDKISGRPVANAEVKFHPQVYDDEAFSTLTSTNGQYQTKIINREKFRVEVVVNKTVIYEGTYESYIPTNEACLQFDIEVNVPEEFNELTDYVTLYEGLAEVDNTEIERIGSKFRTGKKLVLNSIYFDFESFSIKSNSNKTLARIYETLQLNPDLKIEISGHTDNIGEAGANLTLSVKRAESVKRHLVKSGISSNRITTKGFGESKPLASNDDEINGRELNRRIEILVIE